MGSIGNLRYNNFCVILKRIISRSTVVQSGVKVILVDPCNQTCRSFIKFIYALTVRAYSISKNIEFREKVIPTLFNQHF